MMRPIATYHSPFKSKFGLPRQSGLTPIPGEIIFEPDFRNEEAFRDLTAFSHLWLIWLFSSSGHKWHPTVRPPRLGGNRRVGVFASRSPFRPNPIGLSAVRLQSIDLKTPIGPVLHVIGADLADNTPIIDIKPYLPLSDLIPDAVGALPSALQEDILDVDMPKELISKLPPKDIPIIESALKQDPRPAYHNDEDRTYGFRYGQYEIKFRVKDAHLTITDILVIS